MTVMITSFAENCILILFQLQGYLSSIGLTLTFRSNLRINFRRHQLHTSKITWYAANRNLLHPCSLEI
jgi:hypothetical protein